jgi:hypothetical protein
MMRCERAGENRNIHNLSLSCVIATMKGRRIEPERSVARIKGKCIKSFGRNPEDSRRPDVGPLHVSKCWKFLQKWSNYYSLLKND